MPTDSLDVVQGFCNSPSHREKGMLSLSSFHLELGGRRYMRKTGHFGTAIT